MNTVDVIMELGRSMGHWLGPSSCLICIGKTASGPICKGCRDSLPWNRIACPVCALPLRSTVVHVCANCAAEPPHYDSALSAFRYEAPIKQAIFGLKYHAQFRHSRWLGAEIARLAAERVEPLPDLLLPVPLHASRLRERGYNQALELARSIKRLLPVDIDTSCAKRTRATADQIGKRAVERRKEVRNAFAADARIVGRHVAIVDDVMTTGSTVNELARVCCEAGAATIEIWTVARAE